MIFVHRKLVFDVAADGTLGNLGYVSADGDLKPLPACFELAPEIEAQAREAITLGLLAAAQRVARDAWPLRDHARVCNLARLATDIELARQEYDAHN